MKRISNCHRHNVVLLLFVFLHSIGVQADECPKSIGPFNVLLRLGRGGMSGVYQVVKKEAEPGQSLALKILSPDYAIDPDQVRRFQHEFEILKRFSPPAPRHPNIVQVFEYGVEAGQPFYTMEVVPGESLLKKLVTGGVLPPLEVAKIFLQVSEALAAMMQRGLAAHGDIKPANIMVTENGKVKIVDFGLARFKGDVFSHVIDQKGSFLGTAFYLAPEIILGESAADERTDLFAMGVSMFQALTKEFPFDADTTRGVLRSIMGGPIPNLHDHRGGMPEILVRIIHKLIERTPKQRYQTAQEVSHDLRLAIQEMEK